MDARSAPEVNVLKVFGLIGGGSLNGERSESESAKEIKVLIIAGGSLPALYANELEKKKVGETDLCYRFLVASYPDDAYRIRDSQDINMVIVGPSLMLETGDLQTGDFIVSELRAIEERQQLPKVCIIGMISNGDDAMRESFMSLGADHVVTKPVVADSDSYENLITLMNEQRAGQGSRPSCV